MEYINHFLHTAEKIRFIDHSDSKQIVTKPNNALASFAIDDAIATTVGEGAIAPTIRFWVHPKTLVLGIPDARLPHIADGLAYLATNHTDAVIRNSGGLAVLLDENVLNISFILPNHGEVSIDDGYELMFQFVQMLFANDTNKIKAYEIVGSYCPGDYDLSIDGKKFAGISQRRVRGGVAVQIYLDIAGSSDERARIVRNFYRLAKKDTITKHVYPEVRPEVMGSINQLLQANYTVAQVIENSIQIFKQAGMELINDSLLTKEETLFLKRYEQMIKRNEKISSYNPS